jgi:hypothetical protein
MPARAAHETPQRSGIKLVPRFERLQKFNWAQEFAA